MRSRMREPDDAAGLLVTLEDALDAAERADMQSVASLLRIAVTMLKPSVGGSGVLQEHGDHDD